MTREGHEDLALFQTLIVGGDVAAHNCTGEQ
jgi:hypothetical protein